MSLEYSYTAHLQDELDRLVQKPEFKAGASLRDTLKSLDAIRDKRQAFPARFELLRFIEAQDHVSEDARSYTVKGAQSGMEYRFTRLSALETSESVRGLDDAQLDNCVNYLLELALSRDADGYRSERFYRSALDALICKNNWVRYRASDQRFVKRTFDRSCAYELGHALGFTSKQMTHFLVRVLPDAIFKNRDAENLVESYCFKQGLGAQDAQQMLEEYRARRKPESPYAPVEGEDTFHLYDDDDVVKFEGTKEEFVDWLVERSSWLVAVVAQGGLAPAVVFVEHPRTPGTMAPSRSCGSCGRRAWRTRTTCSRTTMRTTRTTACPRSTS